MPTIVIDAGHGGFDNGATYQGRREKDDTLRLALAVGQKLEDAGYDIVYTRTTDEYQSPYEKAQIANESGADYFISFHRNSGENPNTYKGIQSLVYGGSPRADRLAESINAQLEKRGFENLGIEERTGLVVLRRTEMPAVLVEAGFLNSDEDNRIFDEDFYGVVNAIVQGIENAIPMNQATRETAAMPKEMVEKTEETADMKPLTSRYGVEVARFYYDSNANYLVEQLQEQGFDTSIVREGQLIHVVAGNEGTVEDALGVQTRLRDFGYDTLLVSLPDPRMQGV